MKKIFAVLAITAIGFSANAQKGGGSSVSVGVELGLPMGDFGTSYNLGVGGSAKYHYALNDNANLTGTVSYTSFSGKKDVVGDGVTAGIFAFKAGYQHKFEGGFYVEPQLGYGTTSVKVNIGGVSASASQGGLLYAAGVGYVINDMIDLSARYEAISVSGGSNSLVGIRVAYNFSLGK